MKDFMMLFHSEPNPDFNPTPEQIEEEVKAWQDWMEGIGAQGKLKNPGEALGFEGKTMHADGTITDGLLPSGLSFQYGTVGFPAQRDDKQLRQLPIANTT